jgi:hypothetical protein
VILLTVYRIDLLLYICNYVYVMNRLSEREKCLIHRSSRTESECIVVIVQHDIYWSLPQFPNILPTNQMPMQYMSRCLSTEADWISVMPMIIESSGTHDNSSIIVGNRSVSNLSWLLRWSNFIQWNIIVYVYCWCYRSTESIQSRFNTVLTWLDGKST